MNRRPPKDRGPKTPKVVRRSRDERKRLPEDLEAFAGGDDDALWRRPNKRRIDDPRPVQLVPGVANRDARAVYEARRRRAEQARDAGDEDALAVELAEAARLRVWRGHSVVDWDVYTEEVLALPRERVKALREAGLLEAHPEGAVRGRGAGDALTLTIEVPVDRAAPALAAMGRRATPLAREQAETPDSVVDRPKGVQKLSRILERDMRED